jgi:hypothetical protein
MTTRRALFLATVTDGVVEFEREADDADVEALGWVRIERAYSASIEHAMKQEAMASQPSLTTTTLGGLLSGPPVAVDDLRKLPQSVTVRRCTTETPCPFYPECSPSVEKKEANGSNGHGEAVVAELPDLEVYGAIAKEPRKLPSERIAELVAQGPTANQLGTVGWALDVIGRVMDERIDG